MPVWTWTAGEGRYACEMEGRRWETAKAIILEEANEWQRVEDAGDPVLQPLSSTAESVMDQGQDKDSI